MLSGLSMYIKLMEHCKKRNKFNIQIIAIPNSRRYKENGHNLDLTPIELDPVGRCLVVMAWPADEQIFMKDMKRSKLIRNSALEGLFQALEKKIVKNFRNFFFS